MANLISRRKLKKHSKFSPMNSINITPMVDVMLVLLIIFMVTAPLMKSGVHVNLPQTKAKPLKSSKNPVSIIIKKNGLIYIDKKKVSTRNLLANLDLAMNKQFKNQLYIKGDKLVAYGKIAQIMVMVAQHGYTKIALVTIPTPKH